MNLVGQKPTSLNLVGHIYVTRYIYCKSRDKYVCHLVGHLPNLVGYCPMSDSNLQPCMDACYVKKRVTLIFNLESIIIKRSNYGSKTLSLVAV